MAETLRVGDVGTEIIVTITDDDEVVDVSTATIVFIFRKPNCDVVEKTGTKTTDGTDGKVQYTTESGFLDARGEWRFQVRITIGSDVWTSTQGGFTVEPTLS